MSEDLREIEEIAEELDILTTEFDNILEDMQEWTILADKVLKHVLFDHLPLQFRLGKCLARAKRIANECEQLAREENSKEFERRITKDKRSWSYNEAKILAEQGEDYIRSKRIGILATALVDECEEAYKVVVQRGFILNNNIKAAIEGIDTMLL